MLHWYKNSGENPISICIVVKPHAFVCFNNVIRIKLFFFQFFKLETQELILGECHFSGGF